MLLCIEQLAYFRKKPRPLRDAAEWKSCQSTDSRRLRHKHPFDNSPSMPPSFFFSFFFFFYFFYMIWGHHAREFPLISSSQSRCRCLPACSHLARISNIRNELCPRSTRSFGYLQMRLTSGSSKTINNRPLHFVERFQTGPLNCLNWIKMSHKMVNLWVISVRIVRMEFGKRLWNLKMCPAKSCFGVFLKGTNTSRLPLSGMQFHWNKKCIELRPLWQCPLKVSIVTSVMAGLFLFLRVHLPSSPVIECRSVFFTLCFLLDHWDGFTIW